MSLILSEKIYVSTPDDKLDFQYTQIPASDWSNVTFMVRAKRDVHLSLSSQPRDNDDMYVIVIGGDFNKESWLTSGFSNGINIHLTR